MRSLLLSAAALAFLAIPAMAQPDDNPHRIGKAALAPQVQDRAQQQLGVQPAPQQQAQRGGNGGPTSFTNQPPQGTLPGGQNVNGDRGNRGGDRGNRTPAAQPVQPQAAAPQNRGDNRGDRNNGFDRDRNDGRGDNRNDRGNWQGRQGGNNGYNGFNNNRGRGGYGGQRHDFSGFRDYHRDFRASRRFRGPDYRRPAGWYDHRWTFGEFLPSAFWARDYWLSDYGSYDLPPPPYGATWVRVGNDALLVDQDSGEVITVEYGVFY